MLYSYTMYGYFIPLMMLWKQSLLTWSLLAAVTIKVPILVIHFVRQWYHCWKYYWMLLSRIPFSNVVKFCLMSGLSTNFLSRYFKIFETAKTHRDIGWWKNWNSCFLIHVFIINYLNLLSEYGAQFAYSCSVL